MFAEINPTPNRRQTIRLDHLMTNALDPHYSAIMYRR
jgi:hypothetical protein